MRNAVRMTCLLALALLPLAPARAATIFGDITLTVESEPQGNQSHGYLEHWFSLTNTSKERDHRVTLGLPKYSFNYGDHIREVTRTVTVGAGATVRVSLSYPVVPGAHGDGLAVTIDGRTQDEMVRFNTRGVSYGSGRSSSGGQVVVLIGPALGKEADQFQMTVNSLPFWREPPPEEFVPPGGPKPPGMRPPGGPPHRPGMPDPEEGPPPVGEEMPPPHWMGGGSSTVQCFRSDTPLELWSTNWLSYSSYDGIVLAPADLRKLPANVQTALWQYTEAGGVLLILGEGAKVPEGWNRRTSKQHGLTIREAGFGLCIVSDDANFDNKPTWTHERWDFLRASWAQTARPFQTVRTTWDANQLFPVVEDIGIPVRGLFALMIVFTLVIGPVNLFVLSRKKRRLWLLWTVPAISAATCAAVFGYMLVSEGWSGQLRTEGLTVLDETSHRASSIGWTGFYAPLTPGDGLHFSTETELLPQIGHDPYSYRSSPRGSGVSGTLDWSEGQHLAKGWVTPRVPAHFMLRKSEARRERIPIRKDKNGTLTMVNGLGADVRKLWYADETGALYEAGPITSGAQAVLTPAREKLTDKTNAYRLRSLFASDWVRIAQTAPTGVKNLLCRHSYLAELDESPFIEDGMRSAKTRKCRSVVIGFPREGEDE
jgi:hypothetical protein